MATSSQVKTSVQDPLYHYETHFPEKVSLLHDNPEYPQPFSKRKKQRPRSGLRYKTQPVTFDEIQEVDEENLEESKKDGLKNQFQQFSRSMDGLLPRAMGGQRPKPTKSKPPKPTLPVPTEIPRAEERLAGGASSKETSPMPSPGTENPSKAPPPFPAVNTSQNLPFATNETDYRQGRAAKAREARKARRGKLAQEERADSTDT
ncbi:uncharacterized protein LOC135474749 [Liolophura sinensis]|uniref:uncharacterized protein LOC135474749 n=1 Tax=Liolophura sinensis TaxID=3198878 RepID=UPI003158E5B2